jgi:hypothetical protein
MDALELARWTRFAGKGGIGKCSAIVDCIAQEMGEDLMFLKASPVHSSPYAEHRVSSYRVVFSSTLEHRGDCHRILFWRGSWDSTMTVVSYAGGMVVGEISSGVSLLQSFECVGRL